MENRVIQNAKNATYFYNSPIKSVDVDRSQFRLDKNETF